MQSRLFIDVIFGVTSLVLNTFVIFNGHIENTVAFQVSSLYKMGSQFHNVILEKRSHNRKAYHSTKVNEQPRFVIGLESKTFDSRSCVWSLAQQNGMELGMNISLA